MINVYSTDQLKAKESFLFDWLWWAPFRFELNAKLTHSFYGNKLMLIWSIAGDLQFRLLIFIRFSYQLYVTQSVMPQPLIDYLVFYPIWRTTIAILLTPFFIPNSLPPCPLHLMNSMYLSIAHKHPPKQQFIFCACNVFPPPSVCCSAHTIANSNKTVSLLHNNIYFKNNQQQRNSFEQN